MRNWDEWRQKHTEWRELTASDIENLLTDDSFEDTESEFSWYELEGLYSATDFAREGWTLRVTLVDSYGGEGEGDEVAKTIAIAFVDEDGESCATRYLQKPGYRQSYDGTYYDGEIFEVTPVTERVTVWRRK